MRIGLVYFLSPPSVVQSSHLELVNLRIKRENRIKIFAVLSLVCIGTVSAIQLSNYLMFGIVVEAPPYVLSAQAAFPATVSTLGTAQAELRAQCITDGETVYLHIQSDDSLGDYSIISFQTLEGSISGAFPTETGWTSLDGTGHVSFVITCSGSMDFAQFYLQMRIAIQGTYAFTAWLDTAA